MSRSDRWASPATSRPTSRCTGGPDKAVCAYPLEHHALWEATLGPLPPGAFGENLSLRGLVETDARIGDVFRAGSATLQVSQPRGPCFKIAARWGKRQLPARMAREGLSGFYFRVLARGEVGAGDPLELVERHSTLSVAEVMRITYRDRADAPALDAALAVPELAEVWRSSLVALRARQEAPERESGT